MDRFVNKVMNETVSTAKKINKIHSAQLREYKLKPNSQIHLNVSF